MKLLKAIKYLSFGLKNKTGYNNLGCKTVFSKGGGKQKRKFRLIDFSRKLVIPALIIKIEYDPNRSANVALICYKNGFLSYIIATNGMKSNSFLNSNVYSTGSIKKLKDFPPGSFVCCVELRKNLGAKISRSAGCFSVILSQNQRPGKTCLKVSSGEQRFLNKENFAVLGVVSNSTHKLKKRKKAGNSVLLGKKPVVRGVAKNCVDHPHGGGRGKTSPLALASNFTKRVLKGVPSVKRKTKKKRSNWVYKERKL